MPAITQRPSVAQAPPVRPMAPSRCCNRRTGRDALAACRHRSARLPGTSIDLTIGAARPARTSSSNTLSSAAKSEPPDCTTGLISSIWRRTIRGHPGLVGLHPVEIAGQRVDLAVMRQHAERLGQPPGRKGVGRIALVIDGEARDEALIQQVRDRTPTAARPGTCPYRSPSGRTASRCRNRRYARPRPALSMRRRITIRSVRTRRSSWRLAIGDHDLLDFGAGGVGLFADHRDIDRHLAPAINGVAEARGSRIRRSSGSVPGAADRSCGRKHMPTASAAGAPVRGPGGGYGRGKNPAGSRHGCRRRRRSCRRHRPRRGATAPSAPRYRASTTSRRGLPSSAATSPTPQASCSSVGRIGVRVFKRPRHWR